MTAPAEPTPLAVPAPAGARAATRTPRRAAAPGRVGLIACVAAVVLASAGLAEAQKVKTNQATKVYSRPGESGRVILRVKEGQGMKILSREGRWLHVNVAGRQGWVPRSVVDQPLADDDAVQRNTRRRPFVDGRSTVRGASSEGPDDRIGADAVDPDAGRDDDRGRSKKDDDDRGRSKKDDDDRGRSKKDDDDRGRSKKDDDDRGRSKKDDDDRGRSKKDDDDRGRRKQDDDDRDADRGKDGGDDIRVDDGGEGDGRRIAHVAESATMYEEPDRDSPRVMRVSPRDVLNVGEVKGSWTFVQTDEGDAGWVQTSRLALEGGAGPMTGPSFDLHARGGVALISQGTRTVGGTSNLPDNYNLGTPSVTMALGASYLRPRGGDLVYGGEATYDFSLAVPGINYTDPTTKVTQNTGIQIHDLNVRGIVGYDLHQPRGLVLLGRVGFHYENFAISNATDLTKNNARLPSEIFLGPTLGVGALMPRLTDALGLRASLDTLLIGASRKQTKNLEDGGTPRSKAIWLRAVLSYRWKKDMNLEGGYGLTYASTDFGAPLATSMRMHTGTSVSRVDLYHAVSVGVSKAF